MTVIALQPLDKKRTKVCLDNEETFVLYQKELREFHIEQDAELPGEVYHEIMRELLPKRARLRAMHLLEVRPYTEYKLREKLRDGHYPAAIIEDAIEYVKSYGYVDDFRYAIDYATYHTQDRPKGRIRNDLIAKGIAKEIVEEALERAYAESLSHEEQESPERLLVQKEFRKKHFEPETAGYEEKQKMRAYLYRKGFSTDVIAEMVD